MHQLLSILPESLTYLVVRRPTSNLDRVSFRISILPRNIVGLLSPIQARLEHFLRPNEFLQLHCKVFVLHGYQIRILSESTHFFLLVVTLLNQSFIGVFRGVQFTLHAPVLVI